VTVIALVTVIAVAIAVMVCTALYFAARTVAAARSLILVAIAGAAAVLAPNSLAASDLLVSSGAYYGDGRRCRRGFVFRGSNAISDNGGKTRALVYLTIGSPEWGTLGGSSSKAESEVARLAAVLQHREHQPGVSGG